MSVQAQVVTHLTSCPHFDRPAVVTIGNFDGVHLGHQAVLKKTKTLAQQHQAPCVVLTFSNHPSEVLRPDKSVTALCTPEHRYHLLEAFGSDLIVTLTFTPEFAQQTPETFLKHLRDHLPFSHLVLGHDARIGKDRQGDRERVLALATEWGFHVEYLDPYAIGGEVVSSSRIRQYLKAGNLSQAAKLLGRWPSFYGKPVPGRGLGRKIGFPTLNLDITDLCLPPLGVYAVQISKREDGAKQNGVANLGHAPTVRNDSHVILEVHLFEPVSSFGDEAFEVSLRSFIRPEKKFESVEQLKAQISHDADQAKKDQMDLMD